MFKFSFLLLVTFVSSLAFAKNEILTRNPQIRSCIAAGGTFFVVRSEYDEYGVCKLGLSFVGAIDIMNRHSGIEVPFSLNNYKNGIKNCSSVNTVTLRTFDNEPLHVCQYSDGSLIDLETLASGKDSPRNYELNSVLFQN